MTSAFNPCSAPNAGTLLPSPASTIWKEHEEGCTKCEQYPPAVETAAECEEQKQDRREEDQEAEDPVEAEAVIPLVVRQGLLWLFAHLVGGVEGAVAGGAHLDDDRDKQQHRPHAIHSSQ